MEDLLRTNVTDITMEETTGGPSITDNISTYRDAKALEDSIKANSPQEEDDDQEKPIDKLKKSAPDAIDTFTAIKDLRTNIKNKTSAAAGQKGAKSIIGKAAQNLFEFPVFVSSSVPISYATSINSLLEQMYASYLQMAVSMNPVVDEKAVKNGTVFSSWKTNTSQYLEYATQFYQVDACGHTIIRDDTVFEFQMVSLPSDQMAIITEAFDYQPLSEFDHYFQEAEKTLDYAKEKALSMLDEAREAHNMQKNAVEQARKAVEDAEFDSSVSDSEFERLQDALADEEKKLSAASRDLSQRIGDVQKIESALSSREKGELDKAKAESEKAKQLADETRAIAREKREEKRGKRDAWKDSYQVARDKKQDEKDARREAREEAQDQYRRERDTKQDSKDARRESTTAVQQARENIRAEEREKRETKAQSLRNELTEAQKAATEEKRIIDKKVKAPQLMDESKIQKLNTMKPLMMTVGVKVMKDGRLSDMIDYMVGVRTHCRVVDASILPEVVEYPTKVNNLIARKAKWRAGEIRFWEYLFPKKEKQQAAYDSRDPKRKWYHRLYTLAHSKGSSGVAKKITGKSAPEGLIPNVSIVMSQADVNNIEAQVGIDLMKPSNAKRFCDELFLASLIIVDTDSDSVKVLLPAINNDYDVQSLASINKQLETLDTSNTVAREVRKLMNAR